MAIVDIVVAALLLLAGIIGLIRGFAKQILGLLSGFVATVGALLLLKYVYNFLVSFDFFLGWVLALGEKLNGINISFVTKIAEEAGKTPGFVLSEYIIKGVIYLVLAFVLGLIWKLFKKACEAIVSLPGIVVIDKILGFAIAVVFMALVIVVVLLVLNLVAGSVESVMTFFNKFVPEQSLTYKYVVAHLDTIKGYFIYLWDFIRGLIDLLPA